MISSNRLARDVLDITIFTVLLTPLFFNNWNQYFRFYFFSFSLFLLMRKKEVYYLFNLHPLNRSSLMWKKNKKWKQHIWDLSGRHAMYTQVYLGLRLLPSGMWGNGVCYMWTNIIDEPATSIFTYHKVYFITPCRTNLKCRISGYDNSEY